MSRTFTRAELEAYLDEALSPADMVAIEAALRQQPELMRRLAEINQGLSGGSHTLAEIWRRHRITCPPRQQLGSYLLGAMPDERADYIRFHLQEIGCRYCQANLADLQRQQEENSAVASSRRRKYFDTSAGYLPRDR